MSELPLFPDGMNEAVCSVTDRCAEDVLKGRLIEPPKSGIMTRIEEKGTLFEIQVNKPGSAPSFPWTSYGFYGAVSGLLSAGIFVGRVALSLPAAAEYLEKVRMVYVGQRLKVQEYPSDVLVFYQGGCVKDDIAALTTLSVGTVLDFAVGQGVAVVFSGKRGQVIPIPNSGWSNVQQDQTLFNHICNELKQDNSRLRVLLGEISDCGTFRSSRGKYRTRSPALLFVVPCLGKTIVSVVASAFGEPESIGRPFPMRVLGKDRPRNFEISVPSSRVLERALEIMETIQSWEDRMKSDDSPTAKEFGIGASVALALDLARVRYRPDRGFFSMWELVESGPFVMEVVDYLRSNHPGSDISPRTSFPRILIKK